MDSFTAVSSPKHSYKSWNYSEKVGNHTIEHTISISKERFTHESQIKESTQAMRQRTDVSLKNIYSVNSYYGFSRNAKGTFILIMLAGACLMTSISAFVESIIELGFILLLLGIGFSVLAFLTYRKIKLAFILEFETIINNGTIKQCGLSYGNASINLNNKGPKFFLFRFFYNIFHRKGRKYKFIMDEQVGNEIVDTIGVMLMEK